MGEIKMIKVTEKNTKKEILEALAAAQEALQAKKEGKTTTAEIVKEKEVKATKEAAKEIISLGILNDDMTNKYNSLLVTIEMLENDIAELYEIKRNADTLEALINSHKDKNVELQNKYAKSVEELNNDFDTKETAWRLKIAEVQESHNKMVAELKVKFTEEKAQLEKDRKREQEEYTYELKRTRKIEDNNWADEKAAREKLITDRENELTIREVEIDNMLSKIATLETNIEALQAEVINASQEGFAKGKADAEKVTAIRISGIEKEAKWQKEMSDKEIMSLRTALANSELKVESLQTKLDDAYARLNEVALVSAKNSGVRMMETSTK
jgi:hypothetical protein